jgi:ATP-dependent DNA helicase RecQ
MIAGTPQEALARWFPGTPTFRDRQADALERIWRGRSTLVLMPTGTGKSLVFQLPVLASGGIGIVISPLIALMQQHAAFLRDLGANVLSLGGTDATEAQAALSNFDWDRGPSFLFVSPERAETDGYLEFLLRKHRSRVALLAVDEAHCVSQWGHDFRPPFKAIPGFLDRTFGPGMWPTLVALTATLDSHDEAEILGDFRLTSDDVIRSRNMLRTNLDLSFRVFDNAEAKLTALDDLLEAHKGEKVIVYTHLKSNKKAGTRALAERFQSRGFRCAPFDADLPLAEKDETMLAFANGDLDLVFATGAFGMGIDIPDIRGVVHFLLPESLEQYYQEVGRAGRDGRPAFGVLFHTPVNTRVRRTMIEASALSVEDVRKVWDGEFANSKAELRTLDPWVQFQGRASRRYDKDAISPETVHALFYAFQRVQALEVLARGPGRLACFNAKGPEGAMLLKRLGGATATGNTTAAIRKLGLDPHTTMMGLFDLFDRGELRLASSPGKTLVFRTTELSDEQAQAIADDVRAKVDKRLAAFEAFAALVEGGVSPQAALAARFDR